MDNHLSRSKEEVESNGANDGAGFIDGHMWLRIKGTTVV